MRSDSSFPTLLFCVVTGVGCALAYVPYALHGSLIGSLVIVCAAIAVASLVSSSVTVASPWDRAVVLRLGQMIERPERFILDARGAESASPDNV